MKPLQILNNFTGRPATFTSRFGVLYIAKTVPMLVQFAIAWYYSLHLNLSDYGVYQSCWVYIAVLSITGSFGLPVLLLNRNYHSFFSLKNKSALPVLLLIIAAQCAGLLYLFLSNQHLEQSGLWLLFGIAVLQSVSLILETLFIAREKQAWVLYMNTAYALLFGFWHYYVIKNNYSIKLVLTGILILSLIKLLVYFFSNREISPAAAPGIQKTIFFREWFLLGANEVLGILAKWVDKIVILFLFSTVEFGYYFNGAYEIPLFGMLVSVAGNLLVVAFSKETVSKSESISLFKKVTGMLSNLVFPAFVLLLFYHQELFQVLFKAKFNDSIPVFVISLLVLPVRITYYTAVLQIKNRSRLILTGSVLDILMFIALCLILYPIGGKLMIPLSLVLATYFQAGFYLYHTSRLLNCPLQQFFPLNSLLWKMLLCVCVTGLIYFLMPSFTPLLKLLIGFTSSMVLISALFYFEYSELHKVKKS